MEAVSHTPAVPLQALGLVCAIKEFPLEELHSDNGKDEHEEDVDDEDVEDVLQRVHNTIKHGLENTEMTVSRTLSEECLKGICQLIFCLNQGKNLTFANPFDLIFAVIKHEPLSHADSELPSE